jgi:hypothetical protein
MKAYGGVDVQIHIFLIFALVGGEWSALRPSRFTPGESASHMHCIGGLVSPKVGLDHMENCDPSVVHLVASWYTDYAIPVSYIMVSILY